ncbi:MAG TPA: hypothetical protein VER17_04045 [Tepidisphaeraceae bacterium]|nr:hypothetical protein [Tepidisphaeraceae bacterium]
MRQLLPLVAVTLILFTATGCGASERTAAALAMGGGGSGGASAGRVLASAAPDAAARAAMPAADPQPADAPPESPAESAPAAGRSFDASSAATASSSATAPPSSPEAADAAAPVSDGFDHAVQTRAKEQPANLASQFDLQLLRLLRNELGDTPGALPQDERQVLTFVTDALAAFRRSAGDDKSRLATKIEPLADLSSRLKATYPMSIPTLALCRSVTQFGVYDPFDPPRFTAGKETPVIIYCELDNFLSRPASDGRWETRLSYEAVLYTDGDAGVSVISKKPTRIVDRCRNRRRDFFLADRMTLPGTLPVGRYLLKVTVIDQTANHVAERTLPILVAPN